MVGKREHSRAVLHCRAYYLHRGIGVAATAPKRLGSSVMCNCVCHVAVVGIEHNGFAVGKEFGFFGSFLLHRVEVFAVLVGERGEHAQSGANHCLESCHLTGLRNASLDDGNVGGFVDFPQRERHANLRVEAARRAHGAKRRGEQLVQPLLHAGLAAAAGDGNHRYVEPAAVISRQLLQRLQRVGRNDIVGVGRQPLGAFNHKVAHAQLIEVVDVAVPVVVLCA